MPFTPFHLGLGAVVKAIEPTRFSFLIFAGSQVLMDIEPGVRMLQGSDILHGPSHTFLGAIVIGIVAALIGKPITEWTLRMFGARKNSLTWTSVWAGAMLGTLSHVVLDSIMHSDMMPFAPLSSSNPMLGAMDLYMLHLLLSVGAVVGGIAYGIRMLPKT